MGFAKRNTMTTKDIKAELLKGVQFGNEVADWYTINRPNEGLRMLSVRGENKFFKTIDSYAKRISQLIKTGQ